MRDYGDFSSPVLDCNNQRIAWLLEAGQRWQASSVSVVRNALMGYLTQAGSMARADVPRCWLSPGSTPLAKALVTDGLVAQSMDFTFAQPYPGGEVIAKAGTVIAVDTGHLIVTPYDDCVLVMPSVRQLRAGVTTFRLERRL